MSRRRRRSFNWSRLKAQVERIIADSGAFPPGAELHQWLQRLDAWPTRRKFVFWVNVPSRGCEQGYCRGYVLWLIQPDREDDDRPISAADLERLARTMQALQELEFPFDTPEFICFVPGEQDGPRGMITTLLPGESVERWTRSEGSRRQVVQMTADIAAAVHALPPERFPHLPGWADSRTHVLARLEDLPADWRAEDPVAREAESWVREHVPSDRPAALLHGDLLPQNIIYDHQSAEAAVLDWESVRIGDPAYDLSIVTRGNRKLFGSAAERRRLLACYREAGGAELCMGDVLLHELLLVLRWYWEVLEEESRGIREEHGPGYYRTKVRSILKMAAGC